MRRRALNALTFVAIAYVAIVALAWVFQRSLMYFPSGAQLSPGLYQLGTVEEARFAAADGVQLYGWFSEPKPGMPTILYFHGNGGSITGRSNRFDNFRRLGWGVLLVSYRGYAGSEGSPSEDGLYADGEGALAFLEQRGIPATDVVAYGESLGTGVVTYLAERYRFAGLVLEAPFTSIADVASWHYWFLPMGLIVRDRFESLSRMANIEEPVLVLQGERDEVTPVAQGRAILAAAGGDKEGFFPERAQHNDVWRYGGFEIVKAFVERVTN